jgi:glutamate-ammonia-ligase adenylyltransferase
MLRVAAADVTGAIPLMRVSDYLTELAETVLNQVLELVWSHLVQKHGFPSCGLDGNTCKMGFCIVAYGKLGGFELGYGSDLDLVFLHAGTEGQTTAGPHPIDNTRFFARLGQRIIYTLTAHTPAGFIYKTDMRLRPDGSAGMLVVNIESFKDYQTKKAWTWEHQALVRARAIGGDRRLQQKFEKIRREVLSRHREEKKLREDVINMRERMRKKYLRTKPGMFDIKQGPGGIVDIEFLVQYLVLLHTHKYPELLKWTDNVRLIETLTKTGIIDDVTGTLLKEAYLTYRSAVHRLTLQEKDAIVPEKKFNDLREQVKKMCLP